LQSLDNLIFIDLTNTDIDTPAASGTGGDVELRGPVHKFRKIPVPEPHIMLFQRINTGSHLFESGILTGILGPHLIHPLARQIHQQKTVARGTGHHTGPAGDTIVFFHLATEPEATTVSWDIMVSTRPAAP